MEDVKKKKIERVFGIIGFILVVVLIYAYMIVVFAPKDKDEVGGRTFYEGKGFYAEEKNSLDILTFGDSNTYSAYNPVVMYEKTGFTSYGSGVARQSAAGAYNLMVDAFDSQNPKMVIVEANLFFRDSKELSSQIIQKTSLLRVPIENHSRWKTLKARDFYTIPDYSKMEEEYKGYRYSSKQSGFEPTKNGGNYMGDEHSKAKSISVKNRSDMDQIVKLCKKNKTKLIFVSMPCAKSWDYSKHNAVAAYAKKNKIDYYDLNVDPNFEINWKEDTRDLGEHLNVYGAEKVTTYLAENVVSNYQLEGNKHKDSVKKNWDKAVVKFNKTQE